MGKGLKVRAERSRSKPSDWDVFVDQEAPPQGGLPSVQCGVLRCEDGRGALTFPSTRESVVSLLRTEVDPDMFRTSLSRLARQVCGFADVEFVHSL